MVEEEAIQQGFREEGVYGSARMKGLRQRCKDRDHIGNLKKD